MTEHESERFFRILKESSFEVDYGDGRVNIEDLYEAFKSRLLREIRFQDDAGYIARLIDITGNSK